MGAGFLIASARGYVRTNQNRLRMKPTLLIMAAGMGSRYGGLKQLDAIGPSGETIMDYSVFDAARAGFGKAVFVIGRSFEKEFRQRVLSRYEGHIETETVIQSIDALPEGFTPPPGRTKPWGTAHAVLMAKDVIKEPFAVINADDFYGRPGFEALAGFLSEGMAADRYCMVGYRVGNTLSESGAVSRGVCETDGEGFLASITERTEIRRHEGRGIIFRDENDEYRTLAEDVPVSMNMWGFPTDCFDLCEELFREFLQQKGNEMTSEFYIPTVVNEALRSGAARVKVLHTEAKWFGVTYATDRPGVVDTINALVAAGEYPPNLWQ